MTTTSNDRGTATTRTRLTGINKGGLVIAGLLGLTDVLSLAGPTPDGEVGPPYSILLLDGLLGLVTLVGIVVAWRSASRTAMRVIAGSRVLSAITALPAFFVGVPAALKVLVGVGVLLTLASVVMMMSPGRVDRTVHD